MKVKRYVNGLKIESDYFKSVDIKNERFLNLINQAKNRINVKENDSISTKNAS